MLASSCWASDRLSGASAAVDVEPLAGDVAGSRGDDEAYDAGDVFGSADPAEREPGVEAVDVVGAHGGLGQAAAHVGVDEAGGDHVDVDAVPALLPGQGEG